MKERCQRSGTKLCNTDGPASESGAGALSDGHSPATGAPVLPEDVPVDILLGLRVLDCGLWTVAFAAGAEYEMLPPDKKFDLADPETLVFM